MPSRGGSPVGRRTPRSVLVLVISAVLAGAGGLGGCSVGPGAPRDLGDAFGAAAESDTVKPPEPTANTTDQLVLDFLDAAVGGGSAAVKQVSAFFTDNGRRAWLPADQSALPNITVIRVVGQPSSGAGHNRGVPVDVTYQIVGTLNESGRLTSIAQPRNQKARFWVKTGERAPSQLRIDSIDALDGAIPPLMLRDDALNEAYYHEQAIYFWDTTDTVLVPDVRYIARTLRPEKIASMVVGWLGQPSQPGAMLPPPANLALATQPYLREDGVMVLKLTAQAAIKTKPDAADHLLFQLQASLRPYTIDVSVGTQALSSKTPSDYEQYELSSTLPATRKFDITDGVVRSTTEDNIGPVAGPAVLGVASNKNVILAGISRDQARAAFVRRTGSSTALVLAAVGRTVTATLPSTVDKVGRPVWVPAPTGQAEAVVIPWGGELYRIAPDGRATQIPLGGEVTAAAISPDGRRLALIVDGRVQVVPITVDHAVVSPAGPAQPIVIDPRLVATGVAWLSEQQLYIAGAAGGRPALWQVSADGVIAKDRSRLLLDLVPTDVVASPNDAFANNPSPTTVNAVVMGGEAGPYRLTGGPVAKDTDATYPFFVT